MAIKFKDLKEKSTKSPLTSEEIAQIDSLEKYIDSEIKKNYKSQSDEIYIDLRYVQFESAPVNSREDVRLNFGHDRVKKMRKEIERRYSEAGWKFKVEYDDGLDGPNFSGPDYWILSGK